MDQLQKIIRKLTPKMRERVLNAYYSISENKLDNLDIKPLSGRKNWFRCRIGDIRIIFVRIKPDVHLIHEIQFRGKAYKKL